MKDYFLQLSFPHQIAHLLIFQVDQNQAEETVHNLLYIMLVYQLTMVPDRKENIIVFHNGTAASIDLALLNTTSRLRDCTVILPIIGNTGHNGILGDWEVTMQSKTELVGLYKVMPMLIREKHVN